MRGSPGCVKWSENERQVRAFERDPTEEVIAIAVECGETATESTTQPAVAPSTDCGSFLKMKGVAHAEALDTVAETDCPDLFRDGWRRSR